MLTMKSITPDLPLAEFHRWANTQNQKVLTANNLMWISIHKKELQEFFDEMIFAARLEGTEDDMPSFDVFCDIGFLVYSYNVSWVSSVESEIETLIST